MLSALTVMRCSDLEVTHVAATHSSGARTDLTNLLNHKGSIVHWVPGSRAQLEYQANNSNVYHRHLEVPPASPLLFLLP